MAQAKELQQIGIEVKVVSDEEAKKAVSTQENTNRTYKGQRTLQNCIERLTASEGDMQRMKDYSRYIADALMALVRVRAQVKYNKKEVDEFEAVIKKKIAEFEKLHNCKVEFDGMIGTKVTMEEFERRHDISRIVPSDKAVFEVVDDDYANAYIIGIKHPKLTRNGKLLQAADVVIGDENQLASLNPATEHEDVEIPNKAEFSRGNNVTSQNNERINEHGTNRKTEEGDSRNRANEAISVITRTNDSTNQSTSGMERTAAETQDERNERQERLVEQWAKEQGIWYENADTQLAQQYGEPIGNGQESVVYGDEQNHKVIKSKNTLQYHDLQEALIGIELHNQLFPESALSVIGFGKDAEDGFVIIIEQPFITTNEFLSQTEIDEYVEKTLNGGFTNDNTQGLHGRYSNDSIYLRDLHEGNVVRTPQGNTIVIDAIIRPKNINEWINKNYPQSSNNVEFLRTPQGTVYGWAQGNTIHLTKAGLNPNTPVHEYTHLWVKAMQKKDPKFWAECKAELMKSSEWQEVMNNENYANIRGNEDAVASEVLSRLCGKRNHEIAFGFKSGFTLEHLQNRRIGQKSRRNNTFKQKNSVLHSK